MTTEIAATKDGKITGLRVYTLADHGAFDACANAIKWPAGLLQHRHRAPTTSRPRICSVDGVYTNKAPGGVAYRCSFRVTEAAYCIERAMDIMAQKLGMDPAEFRLKNLIRREQFPYTRRSAGNTIPATTTPPCRRRWRRSTTPALRAEQKAKQEAFKRGETRELMGIGVAFFTEIVGAGPSRDLRHPRHRHVRLCRDPHPSDRQRHRRLGTKSQGQGHETTYAQIIATELGLPADNIMVEEGNTDTAPYGLGTYGSRSTPVSGAATAMACAQDQGQGADDRRLHARSARRRPRMGHRPLPGEGQSRSASRR